MAAQLYSQMLTLSGLPYAVGQWLQAANLSFVVVLFGYLAVVIVLGCFLDSLSIMLIILPFVLPVIDSFGVNLVWFGLITIVAIEIGLLTPPLGMSVFVVKANLGNADITTWRIFMGTMPMTITMAPVPAGGGVLPVAFAGAARQELDLVVARQFTRYGACGVSKTGLQEKSHAHD